MLCHNLKARGECGERQRERWMMEVWRRIRKLDKEVVCVRGRIRANCSPEMRRLSGRGSFTGPSVENRDWEVWGCVLSVSLTHMYTNTRTHTHAHTLTKINFNSKQTKTPHTFYSAYLHHFSFSPPFFLVQLKCMELSDRLILSPLIFCFSLFHSNS